jgi:L-lactate dehydrogenase complex protein LldG
MDAAREETLGKVRAALGRRSGTHPASGVTQVLSLPSTARVAPRTAGVPKSEMEQLLAEIRKLSGVTRRLASRDELCAALAELVRAEAVKKATLWTTPDLAAWDIAGSLRALGVEIVPPQADKRLVAECELGVTGVDAALPETGTLLLRSAPDRPRVVSLLPRVHLAILTPAALRPDLHQAFAEAKDAAYSVLVTGPSRTADIELTLTLGVHGPKSLYAWVMNAQ